MVIVSPGGVSPTAAFEVSGALIVGQPATFTDRSSGTVAWAYWNFGDGSNARDLASTTHVFSMAGTYEVRFSICAAVDRCDSTTQSVDIAATSPAPTTLPPTQPGPTDPAPPGPSGLLADFSYQGVSASPTPVAGVPITFDDRSTGTVAWVYWDFGDGSTSRKRTTSHTYAAPGTYVVRYSVCADEDVCDMTTRRVEVAPSDVESPVSSIESVVLGATQSRLRPPTWSPDGALIAVDGGVSDTVIEIWDADELTQPRLTLRGHTDTVSAMAWSPDSSQLATSARNDDIRVWDLADPKNPLMLEYDHLRSLDWERSLAWSPDGTRLLTVGGDEIAGNRARVWDLTRPQEPEAILDPGVRLRGSGAQWSPDGSMVLLQGEDFNAYLWDRNDWSEPMAVIERPAGLFQVS